MRIRPAELETRARRSAQACRARASSSHDDESIRGTSHHSRLEQGRRRRREPRARADVRLLHRGARDQDLPARGLRHRGRPPALARSGRSVALRDLSAAAVAGSRIVVPSPSGYLYAHDVTTGKRLWRTDLPVTDSAPAIANGVVYVGSGDGNLYAFGLKDGRQLWSARLGAKAVTSSPTLVGGAVYVGSDEGNVVAFRR